MCCYAMQCVSMQRNAFLSNAMCCYAMQHVTMQCNALLCNAMQRVAMQCNVLLGNKMYCIETNNLPDINKGSWILHSCLNIFILLIYLICWWTKCCVCYNIIVPLATTVMVQPFIRNFADWQYSFQKALH